MGTRLLVKVLVLNAVCLCLLNHTGFALNIKITPKQVNGLIHNNINISCHLDNADADVKEIALFELTKEDAPIVVLRENAQISIHQHLDTKFKAEGTISKTTPFDSYIQATLMNPEVDDSGAYTCKIYYLDQFALLKEIRAPSENLTVSDQDLKSAVRYLVDEMSKMKTDHRDEMEEQRNQSMTEIGRLTQQIKQLEDKAATSVMFTAWRDKSNGIQSGKVINFGKVVVNEGGAYDGTTGIFTAPVAGYYLFHFSLGTEQTILVDLKSGSGETLSRIYAGIPHPWTNFAAGSSVVKLKARDTVMPVVERMDAGMVLYFEGGQYFMHRFDGYLLKTF